MTVKLAFQLVVTALAVTGGLYCADTVLFPECDGWSRNRQCR